MDLSNEINEEIYLHNGFRIFNIPINASQRKVKNEFDNVESVRQLGGFGPKDSLDVYSNLPFPITPKPNYIDYQNAKNRLNQPRTRFIDELFWFWPEDLANKRDPTIKALKRGNIDEAVALWDSSSAANAAHNLAVYNHIIAIDKEGFNDSSDYGDGNEDNWREAINQWRITLSNNDFKNLAIERVQQLDDPTMRQDYVEEIFSQLAVAILSINVSIASNYLKAGNKPKFEKHLLLVDNSGFDDLIKETALQPIFNNLYDSVNGKFEEFENGKYKTESDISKVEGFLDSIENELGFLKNHFSSNFQYQSLSDKIANSVKNKLVGIFENIFENVDEGDISKIVSFDFNRMEKLFRRIVDLAYAVDVKENIEENLNSLKSITSQLEDRKVHDKINEFAGNLDNHTIRSAKSYANEVKRDLGSVNPQNYDNFADFFAMTLDAFVVSTINSYGSDLDRLKSNKYDLLGLLNTAKKYAVESETKEKIKGDIETLEKMEEMAQLTPKQIEQLEKLVKASSQGNNGSSGGSGGGPTVALGCIIWIVIIAAIIAGAAYFMGWI